jgi:hypothetical protein
MDSKQVDMMERVEITRPFIGLLYMQVCAVDDATDKEILEKCNKDNVCGTTLGWATVHRNPIDELKKPGPCADIPGRTHFLVSC